MPDHCCSRTLEVVCNFFAEWSLVSVIYLGKLLSDQIVVG